ncbi:hypothetical protein LIER_25785 [Lithospermum erythrorhizon]|uniref:Uncharacterized protein n=1 Tax=Lithospermum erythrorhizon TaxID=34254 RepID=A0AAV3R9F7_LITER
MVSTASSTGDPDLQPHPATAPAPTPASDSINGDGQALVWRRALQMYPQLAWVWRRVLQIYPQLASVRRGFGDVMFPDGDGLTSALSR